MPKYIIERELLGAGELSSDQLKEISQTSCDLLNELDPKIQWVHSYVTDNKIYCIYNAPSESKIREHAEKEGFPINNINKVSTIIDPVTAE